MQGSSQIDIEHQMKSAFANLDSLVIEKQFDAFILLRQLSAETPDSQVNILFKDELFKRIVSFISAEEYEEHIKPIRDYKEKEMLIHLISLAT